MYFFFLLENLEDKTSLEASNDILRDRRIQKKKSKTRKSRRRRQLKCENDFDCYRGQYCATDKSLCLDEGHQQFGEECTRNGGNCHKILYKL